MLLARTAARRLTLTRPCGWSSACVVSRTDAGTTAGAPPCRPSIERFFLRKMADAGYLQGHSVDPYVVATHSDGGQGAFGYCVYPMGDGSSGYFQPVWMAVM
ncbi:hypothetical protein VPH35_044167 [Triticum aestivum]